MPASTTQFPTNNPRVDGPGTPRVNYIELGNTPTHHVLGACVSARVTAAIAKGKHPVPSRTRKLSLSAPMVLQPRGCGRVGRRRTIIAQGHPFGGGPAAISGSFRERSWTGHESSTSCAPGAYFHRPSAGGAALSVAPRMVGRGGDVHVS